MSARTTPLLATLCVLAAGCGQADNSAEVALELSGGVKPVTAAVAAPAASESAQKAFNPRLLRRFVPARATIADVEPDAAKIELGRMLYHDKRLSKNQDLSCNSCHQLDHYGVESAPTSKGPGGRNAPTVFHAAGHFGQNWDGRAATIEEQALGAILNPIEMAAPNEKYVMQMLSSMPAYVAAFKKAFAGEKDPLSFVNVGRAIGAFERKLTTRARWDDYLEGKTSALSDKEVEGLKLFTNLGCMGCHTGEFLGGSMYEKVGTVQPWPRQIDQGRFDLTHREGDRMLFKVPTLRNISETAPYFHDGSAATLQEAVGMMGKHQLGLQLDSAEVDAIVTWLNSLKGELPASTATTPKPDRP